MTPLVMPTKDAILLTGAGFTKNFGGFTGQEMWNRLLNHPLVQSSTKLHTLLLNDFDFEKVYAIVFDDSKYNDEDRRGITEAIKQAYEDLDEVIVNWNTVGGDNKGFSRQQIFGQFLGMFCGDSLKRGMIFTLNQDLFIERGNGIVPFMAPPLPSDMVTQVVPMKDKKLQLPSLEEIEKRRQRALVVDGNSPFYIKLHGSYGWYSCDGTGQERMIIGQNKKDQISKEPLLRLYFELFEGTIAQGGKEILICGYGFGDKHINDVLREGVEKYGLKINILSPSTPTDLQRRMNGTGLWPCISRIFPYIFKDLFPNERRPAPALEEIRRAIQA